MSSILSGVFGQSAGVSQLEDPRLHALYGLENSSGAPARCWVVDATAAEPFELSNEPDCIIAPGETAALPVDAGGAGGEYVRDPRGSGQVGSAPPKRKALVVQLEGCLPMHPIALDKLGEHVIDVPLAGSGEPLKVACIVSRVPASWAKVLTLRSRTKVVNETGDEIGITFDKGIAYQAASILRVPAGSEVWLPVMRLADVGQLRWVPAGDVHRWSAPLSRGAFVEPVPWSTVAARLASYEYRGESFVRPAICAPLYGSASTFTCSLSASTLPGGEVAIRFRSPLTVVSELPVPSTITIRGEGGSFTNTLLLLPRGEAKVHQLPLVQDGTLEIRPAGYRWSSQVPIPVPASTGDEDNVHAVLLELEAESSHPGPPISLKMLIRGDGETSLRRVVVRCLCWVQNLTTVPVELATRPGDSGRQLPAVPLGTDLVALASAVHSARTIGRAHSDSSIQQAGPWDNRVAPAVGLGGAPSVVMHGDASDWSASDQEHGLDFHLRALDEKDAPPSERVVLDSLLDGTSAIVRLQRLAHSPSAEAYVFAVTAESSPGAGPPLITVTSRYILSNRLGRGLRFRALQGKSKTLHLALGKDESAAVHSPRGSFRFAENGWAWSGTVALDTPGDTLVKMSNRNGVGMQVVRVTVREHRGALVATVRAPAEAPLPYRLENNTSCRVRVYQEGSASSAEVIMPHSVLPYAWDEPLNPRKLNVFVGGTWVALVGLDTASAAVEHSAAGSKYRLHVRAEGPTRVLAVEDVVLHPVALSPPAPAASPREVVQGTTAASQGFKGSCFVLVLPAGVGVSVVGGSEELLYASLGDIRTWAYVDASQQSGVEAHVSRVQVDNQLSSATAPVMVACTPLPPARALKLRLALCRTGVTVRLRDLYLEAAPVVLELDEQLLSVLPSELAAFQLPLPAPAARGAALDAPEEKVYVERLRVAPLALQVSIQRVPGLPAVLKPLAGIQDAVLSFASFQLDEVGLVPPEFGALLQRHYLRALITEAARALVGSSRALGNPRGLFARLRAARSPGEAARAVGGALATGAATAHEATARFSASVDRSLGGAGEPVPDGVLASAIASVGNIVAAPVRGAEEGGVLGLLGGAARGVLGTVVRPTLSASVSVTKVAVSVLGALNGELPPPVASHVRPPRWVPASGPLPAYRREEAAGRALAATACDAFVAAGTLAHSAGFVVLTEHALLGGEECSGGWSVVWRVPLRDVLHVHRHGSTLEAVALPPLGEGSSGAAATSLVGVRTLLLASESQAASLDAAVRRALVSSSSSR